jgi:hypothetical protein
MDRSSRTAARRLALAATAAAVVALPTLLFWHAVVLPGESAPGAYLAFDVFRRTLGFSIVLAGFGITIILLTVWLQKRYPALARRVAEERGAGRPALPGGSWVFGLGVLLTLVLLLTAPPRARRAQTTTDELTRRSIEESRRADSTQPPPRPVSPR